MLCVQETTLKHRIHFFLNRLKYSWTKFSISCVKKKHHMLGKHSLPYVSEANSESGPCRETAAHTQSNYLSNWTSLWTWLMCATRLKVNFFSYKEVIFQDVGWFLCRVEVRSEANKTKNKDNATHCVATPLLTSHCSTVQPMRCYNLL